jgi:hypothetical protein
MAIWFFAVLMTGLRKPMTSREDIQLRIGDYEQENERLSGLAACLRRKLEENEAQIALNKRLIADLRWAGGLDGAASPPIPKPREKILVHSAAMQALAAQPMTEEALIAQLGISERAVQRWVVRALRKNTIIREDGVLGVVDPSWFESKPNRGKVFNP